MKYLQVPHTEQRLFDGSVVVLKRFPNTKWIVHNSWYTYMGQQYNGWHFSSIPSQTIVPMNARDLHSLTIVSNFVPGPAPGVPRPPKPPVIPGPPWIDDPYPEHDHDHDHGPGPRPPHPPKPPVPPAPPAPPEPVKSPERYFGGVNYLEGQLIYLSYGSIYQATVDFRSSWKAPSLMGNLKKDIQSGYLVPVPATVAKEVTDALEAIDAEINNIKAEQAEMAEDLNTSRIQKYLINFQYAFGTDEPTKEDADKYLSELIPPVVPSIGIFFMNLDNDAANYRHIYTYYPRPESPGKLIFFDQTVDVITTGPVVEDVIIEALPGGGYKFKKTIRQLETGATTLFEEDLPLATLDDIQDLLTKLDTKVDKKVAGDGGYILQSSKLALTPVPGQPPALSLSNSYLSLENGSTKTEQNEIKLVDWGIPTIEELEALDAKVQLELDKKVNKNVTLQPILQKLDMSGTADGIKILANLLGLADGSTSQSEQLVTLLEMGAASESDLQIIDGSVNAILEVLEDLKTKGVQIAQV